MIEQICCYRIDILDRIDIYFYIKFLENVMYIEKRKIKQQGFIFMYLLLR